MRMGPGAGRGVRTATQVMAAVQVMTTERAHIQVP